LVQGGQRDAKPVKQLQLDLDPNFGLAATFGVWNSPTALDMLARLGREKVQPSPN
jgi:hypothetical protein